MKILITFSAGGHYIEAQRACHKLINDNEKEIVYVTYKTSHSNQQLTEKKIYFIAHPKHGYLLRRLLLLFINGLQSLFIIIKEHPKVIISTGADVTFFIMLWGKLFRSKIIFIESGANVTSQSLTGRLVYPFADLFIIQWEELKQFYPNAVYGGCLL
ncbi:MAG: hypothetical protein JXB17_11955 [Bacteroidales bacterium]|nr:hypothetical protein [Bacteroidales bacterium]